MATQFTRYADKAILNALFKGVALPNNTWYMGALKYTNDATAAGTAVDRDGVKEVPVGTYTDYARIALGSVTLTDFVVGGAAAYISNDAQALFAQATSAWGNIVGIGLWDAATNGNLWVVTFALLAQQSNIRAGDRLTVPAQQLQVQGGSTT